MEQFLTSVLVIVIAFELRVSSQPNPCPIGYRPFSCTVCIMITEDELPFSQSLCPSSRISFQLDNVQNRTLQRYLEVYNNTLLWTDYEIKNGKAILPNSTTTVGLPIIGAKTCSNCCLALQLDPYGLMVSDCERALPAVCFTSVNYAHNLSEEFTGSGESSYVSVVIDEMLQPDDRNHSVKFGSNITLNCSHEIGASVRWYVNSKVVDVRRPSSLLTVVFSQPGVYLCQVTTSEVDEEVRSVLLCGIDGEPGDVQLFAASTYSQTGLTVTWDPPYLLGTIDPLLLRYNLYYSSQDVLDESSKMIPVIPQLPNGTVRVQLADLNEGTLYVIGVVAASTSVPTTGEFPLLNIVISTYGKAPTSSVSDLTLHQWKEEEKSLIASWDKAQLLLPEGPVSFYEVEYRDGEQGLSNKVHVQPDASFFIIHGVENGNKYEVRVAILVEIYQDPLQHDRSQWTDWVRVTANTSGKVKPTNSEGEVKPTNNAGADDDVILPAILMPLAVLLVSILLFTACICFLFCKKTEHSYPVQKLDCSDAVEGKTLTSTDV